VVAGKCKAWKINVATSKGVMEFFRIRPADIMPGGADWEVFQKDVLEAQDNISSLDGADVCEAAKMMFGPGGQVSPDLLIPSGN